MSGILSFTTALPIILGLTILFFTPSAGASPAPDFSLPTKSGTITLSQLKGKVVYLDFWASWCIPCRKSFSWMNEMTHRYGKEGFVIVAVNLDKDEALMKRFIKQYPADFIIAYDPAGDIARNYQVKGMPSSYLLTRDGAIHSSHIGFRSKDKAVLETKIRTLLTHSPH